MWGVEAFTTGVNRRTPDSEPDGNRSTLGPYRPTHGKPVP